MKITHKQVESLAKHARTLGFEGKRVGGLSWGDYLKAIKAFLIAQGVQHITANADGAQYETKALMVEQPDENTVVVTLVEDEEEEETEEEPAEAPAEGEAPPAQLNLPADVEVLVKSVTEAALKAAGITPKARMQMAGGTVTAVRSKSQRVFEDRLKRGQTALSSYDTAFGLGNFLAWQACQQMGQYDKAKRYAKAYGDMTSQKAYTSTWNTEGGALTAEAIDADVIRLVSDYGSARKLCRIVPMSEPRISRPRANGALSVFYPEEGGAATESSETWDNVQMTAKKGITLTKMSREIQDDAIISLAEDTSREIARAFAKIEDDTLFNGEGGTGSDYIPQVNGILNQFGKTTAATNSRTHTGGDTTAAHTTAQLAALMMLLPDWVTNPVWTCTRAVYDGALLRLGAASGGVTWREFEGGPGSRELPHVYGYPVIFNTTMNRINDVSGDIVDLLFGDVSLAADLGDRMAVEIDISDQRYWDEANIGIRGMVRHDINVHDLGATTGTPASPVVGLYQT